MTPVLKRDAAGARSYPAPRVLLVTPQPFFEERGTPIAVALTVRALAELGYEVDLLAFPMGRSLDIPGVRIIRCDNPLRFRHVPVGFSLRKVLLDMSLLKSFEELLASRDYAVVHAVEEAAWLASVVCPVKEVPFIYDMASAIPQELASHRLLGREPLLSLLRGTERRVIGRAAHVICSGGLGARVSSIDPNASITEWRFPVTSSDPAQGAVELLRQRHEIAADDRVLLYTGNFSKYQGIDVLLEAFGIACARDPRLLLVCVGARDETQAAEYGKRMPADLRARARILVRSPRAMMPAWFSLADCLVSLRTSGNNVPLKVFEYMAARRPIVASRGPAHEPILNDSRAFLCGVDVVGVADAIGRVFGDPARAGEVADNAADYASRNFSWARFRQLVGGVYARVLQPSPAVSRESAASSS